MTDRAVISVHVKPETRERLTRLAETTRRSRSFLAAEAIEDYLALHDWQVAEIESSIAELERGETVAQEEVEAWAATLAAPTRVANRRR